MEVGVEVWLRDTTGDQAWLPAIIESKNPSLDGSGATISVRVYSESIHGLSQYNDYTFKYVFVDTLLNAPIMFAGSTMKVMLRFPTSN